MAFKAKQAVKTGIVVLEKRKVVAPKGLQKNEGGLRMPVGWGAAVRGGRSRWQSKNKAENQVGGRAGGQGRSLGGGLGVKTTAGIYQVGYDDRRRRQMDEKVWCRKRNRGLIPMVGLPLQARYVGSISRNGASVNPQSRRFRGETTFF